MEEWVSTWVRARRSKGERGIEIKNFGSSYYVYRSTTFWDRKSKKRQKKSAGLGKLDKERGFISSKKGIRFFQFFPITSLLFIFFRVNKYSDSW